MSGGHGGDGGGGDFEEEPEPHENHERYLLTYADMITLLMALFIILFAIGQTEATLLIHVNGDSSAENTEGFAVSLGTPTNGRLGSASTATGSGSASHGPPAPAPRRNASNQSSEGRETNG